jgi:hypothetical protein
MARANRLHTVQQLRMGGVSAKYKCFLAIPRSEWSEYSDSVPPEFDCLPLDCTGINNVRQYIMEHCTDNKVLMIDDDLSFFHRPSIKQTDLYQATGPQIMEMIEWLDDALENYAHCSISARTQNFQNTYRLIKANSFELETTRPWRVYGFRKDIFMGEQLDFHAGLDINTMDDFHMTLQLLELGYRNLVNFNFAHEQRGSNSTGGAATYRDLELLKICALNLVDKHPPGIVKAVKRRTINSWGGTPQNPVYRTDVRIQWQKALATRVNDSKL